MFYYILSLHFVWAVYATVVNRNISEKHDVDYNWAHHLMAFAINFFACPLAIIAASWTEWNDENTILDGIYKKYFQ